MTPRIIRAAVLREIGAPLCVEEVEIPKLERGQVLVKIAFSGVCRSQLMEVRGGRGVDEWLPHLLGHEGAGTSPGQRDQCTASSLPVSNLV